MESRKMMMSERRVLMDTEGHMSTETMTTHNNAEQRVVVDTCTGTISSPATMAAALPSTSERDQPPKMVSDATLILTESGRIIPDNRNERGDAPWHSSSEPSTDHSEQVMTKSRTEVSPKVLDSKRNLPESTKPSDSGHQPLGTDTVTSTDKVSNVGSSSHARSASDTGNITTDTGARSLEDEINWRKRCQTLETSLLKFKQRTADIRDRLAHKVIIFSVYHFGVVPGV